MAPDEAGSALTFDLRGLVWGIQSEVEVITALCGRIDDHVQSLNDARAQLAQRLTELDQLLEATDDPRLRAWLESLVQAPLPQAAEVFPDRLYAL